jgi:hypothetical protein
MVDILKQNRIFIEEYLKKTFRLAVLVFGGLALLFILFQITSLTYSLNITKSEFKWLAVLKYFIYELVYLFIQVFPVCVFGSAIYVTINLRRKNYFLRYILAGYDIKFVFIRLLLFLFIINLFFNLTNETLAKRFKKNAEIVYDDEIIVKLYLDQRYTLVNSKSINPDDKISIIFEYLGMDNAYSDTLSLSSIFLLEKSENKTDFIWSNQGQLFNDYLQLRNPVYHIELNKAEGEAPDWKRSILESEEEYGYKIDTGGKTLRAESSKLENVSVFALTLEEYFNMYYWANKTGTPETGFIASIICFTLFLYLLFPMLMIFIALRIAGGNI